MQRQKDERAGEESAEPSFNVCAGEKRREKTNPRRGGGDEPMSQKSLGRTWPVGKREREGGAARRKKKKIQSTFCSCRKETETDGSQKVQRLSKQSPNRTGEVTVTRGKA